MTLTLTNLSATYGKTDIVHGINAAANTGEFIGLVGPNGAGKSCLLKVIAGLLKISSGNVNIDGKNIADMPAKALAKQIAYLAQERTATWPLTARALVALGRAPYRGGLGKLNETDEAAIEIALTSAQCEDLQDRRFDRLSGGEQARIYLARALAVDAPLLLADEPTASLDPYYQLSILETLRIESARGKTVIASLHDLTLAKQFCSRIWVLDHGKLVEDEQAENALGADVLKRVFRIKTKKGALTLSERPSEI